jgi:hypothetical protein
LMLGYTGVHGTDELQAVTYYCNYVYGLSL